MPRRQYRNPPIQEAVCEFRFAPENEWSPIYPSSFFEKIRGEYPGKPREQKMMNIDKASNAAQPGLPPNLAGMVLNEVTRLQFFSADEKNVVSIHPDVLSNSVQRPYPGWETFKPSISSALNTYVGVAAPLGIRRIGLRYINQIEVSGGISALLECLVCPPPMVPAVDCRVENFGLRTEYIYNDQPITVVVTLARVIAPEGRCSCLLDIDTSREWPAEPLNLKEAMNFVQDLRDRERHIFESLITDRARERFDA